MIKYITKHHLKLEGKMSKEDAAIVGKKYANAALILAIGISVFAICYGLSFIL